MHRIAAITVLIACAAASFGQTSPALLIRPWAQLENANPAVEAYQDALVMPGARGDGNYHASISIFETAARWRLDPNVEHSVTLGFQQTIVDGGRSRVIDLRNRVDQSLAVGIPLGKTDEGWKFGMTAGLGYAGNNAYGDGDAWYGLGSLVVSKELDESSSLQLLLVYDGNGSLLPDVPLPAVSYNHQVSDRLAYSVGLPYSSVVWRPLDQLTLRASYVLPTAFSASAAYRVVDAIDLFASYERSLYVFHDSNLSSNRRVFFSQQRVEGGVQWNACANASATLAGGLAFKQEYQTGYDVRDLHNSAQLHDEPYVRVAVDIRF